MRWRTLLQGQWASVDFVHLNIKCIEEGDGLGAGRRFAGYLILEVSDDQGAPFKGERASKLLPGKWRDESHQLPARELQHTVFALPGTHVVSLYLERQTLHKRKLGLQSIHRAQGN